MTYHTLIIVGRLGGSPEMRYLPNGQAVVNFSVATDRSYKDSSGNTQKITTWFKVSVFGKMAEACNEYLSKGSMVLVEGVLNPGENGHPKVWTSNSGVFGANYEVFAQTVRFLSTQKKQESEVMDEQIPF
jgi:single-strand DNA-binding protein